MSLRINQNVTSLSTYSNLSNTTNKMEKSIAKLSSGLRINTAADDAAGLAISEKMRSQVRGLNRAKLNAQDGVSMIQAAEGGLNETESIIQRMRELAIQGSNDTLTSNDRLEIQKEINQLKTAIDDISNSTEFNTKKLLNGSQTASLSSTSNAITGLVTGNGAVGGDYQVSMTVLQGGISQMQRTQIFMDKDTGELAKGNTKLEDIAQFYDENGVFALATSQTLTVTGNSESSEVSINGKMTLNELASTLQNAIAGASHLGIRNSSVSVINTVTSQVSGVGGYLEFTSGAIGESGQFSIAGEQKMMDALGMSVTREAVNNVVQLRLQDTSGNIRTINTSSDRATGLIEGMDLQFSSTAAQIAGNGGIVDGLKFETAEILKFQFKTSAGATATEITVAFAVGDDYSMEGIAAKINRLIFSATGTISGAEATVVDGQIRLSYNPNNGTAPTDIDVTHESKTLGFLVGNYSGFVDGEKDTSKSIKGISMLDTTMTAGNTAGTTLTVKIQAIGGNKTITVGQQVGAGVADLIEIDNKILSSNTILATAGISARLDVINGSMAFTSTVMGQKNNNNAASDIGNITISSSSTVLNNLLGYKDGTARGSGDTNYRVRVVDNTPVLQIGANAGQQMEVGISNMSAAALGIDKLDMSSSEGAQTAIEKIDQALGRVSAERSKLGAFSNRLQYTMNNLENTATNLTDAESRIRDVDMAMEMISFTSAQIMNQSGTAMLAQANAMGQSVLSLLG